MDSTHYRAPWNSANVRFTSNNPMRRVVGVQFVTTRYNRHGEGSNIHRLECGHERLEKLSYGYPTRMKCDKCKKIAPQNNAEAAQQSITGQECKPDKRRGKCTGQHPLAGALCAKHTWRFAYHGCEMNVYRCEVCGAETDDWMNWGDL